MTIQNQKEPKIPLTLRVRPEIRAALESLAEDRKCTITEVVEEILTIGLELGTDEQPGWMTLDEKLTHLIRLSGKKK